MRGRDSSWARHLRDTIESEMGNPIADWLLATPGLSEPAELTLNAEPGATALSMQVPLPSGASAIPTN